MNEISPAAGPSGELTLQTLAMPSDTNPHGDIFGGWLLSQMDLAGSVLARRLSNGRVATVAISNMAFLRPVPVGALVGCYTTLLETGHSSMRVNIEVWIQVEGSAEWAKVTEGDFVYVAISPEGKTRPVR
ncbi:MAG TPA: acyl-CoA thioesterase [Porticoccaceae bacterium]